ncbi:DUF3592 domain-containing protein [Actinomadura sp. DC4]|uniref:DUF3592 domain-containing protein n=1 Tax=Actinomadura sp. DC4 TaxID=3055069 RepID=UPI0025B17E89|nr:DUF3592 domain-containing protein [Actinomadura sp. DC4]MDN3351332.1 hypothetical protein [Actinomadura sp. DC4]
MGAYGFIALIFGCGAVLGALMTYSSFAHGVETSATVIKGGTARGEATIEFTTEDGQLVRTRIGGSEVGRTGDTSKIRYSPGDPSDVSGAGWENLTVDIVKTLAVAVVAAYGAVMTYRRIRRRPRAAPVTPDHRSPRTSATQSPHARRASRERA